MGCEHLADVTNHCSKGASRSTHTLVFSEQVGWGLLFLEAAVIWFLNVLSPKVPCVNKFFSLGWQHGDMVEPDAHPSTGGGGEGGGRRIRTWLTALVTELVWSQLGHMSYHLSQRRTVVGPGDRTTGNGVCPLWGCGTPVLVHRLFLGHETSSLVPCDVLTYHMPRLWVSTGWGQSVMD